MSSGRQIWLSIKKATLTVPCSVIQGQEWEAESLLSLEIFKWWMDNWIIVTIERNLAQMNCVGIVTFQSLFYS